MTPLISQRALDIAAGELAKGVHESQGPNRGPDIDKYVRSRGSPLGVPWCGAFAAWCITEAARQLGLPNPLHGWGDLMSAYKWRDAGRSKGRWTGEPYPGMVGVQYDDGHHHVVLVKDYGCGLVDSLEGNFENRVASVERPVGAYDGFVDWARADDLDDVHAA